MATAGVADTPLNRWNYGLETLTGTLRKHSIDEIRRATWPQDEARPTKEGLHWRGLNYTSSYIQSRHVHLLGKNAKKKVSIQFNPDSPSQILIPGDMKWEYAKLAKNNEVRPAGGTLMEWAMYRYVNKLNARKEHAALQPKRIMDALNNAEESRTAKQEQSKALKQAGIDHPRQQRRKKSSAILNVSEMVKKMNKPKLAGSRQKQDREDIPEIDGNQHRESEGNGSIAEKMSKNMRDILDSI